MKPKIDVFQDRNGFGLAWFDLEDGEGLRFGDVPELEKAPKPPEDDPDMFEHWHAYQAIKDLPGVERYGNVLIWSTISEVMKARAAARLAVKLATSTKPLPDWATTALSAGWKPPKGWKP